MKGISQEHIEHYSEQHQSLRRVRNQLRESRGDRILSLSKVSDFETGLVQEALEELAKLGVDVTVTADPGEYNRFDSRSGSICLLRDDEGNLQDLSPLLPYVSQQTKRAYEATRGDFLGSHQFSTIETSNDNRFFDSCPSTHFFH
jgi:hypothetical protein